MFPDYRHRFLLWPIWFLATDLKCLNSFCALKAVNIVQLTGDGFLLRFWAFVKSDGEPVRLYRKRQNQF